MLRGRSLGLRWWNFTDTIFDTGIADTFDTKFSESIESPGHFTPAASRARTIDSDNFSNEVSGLSTFYRMETIRRGKVL